MSTKSLLNRHRIQFALTAALILANPSISVMPALSAPASSAKAPASAASKNNPPKENAELTELLKSAWILNLSGENQKANDKANACLKLAEKNQDDKAVIKSLDAIADIFEWQGMLPEQEAPRKRALELAANKFTKTSPEYALQLAKLSSYYARKGEQGQARDNLDQAMSILGNAESKYPKEMASCYLALARRQVSEGTFGLADDSFSKALQLQDGAGNNADQAEVLQISKEYSTLLDKLGRKAEADKLKDRINLARASASSTGSSNKAGATADSGGKGLFFKLIADAKTAADAGDHPKAKATWKLALQEAEKSANDRKRAFVLVHLADEYRLEKQNEDATSFYRQAISLREKAGITDDLGMARNLTRLAQCYIMDKKSGEAESLLRKALEIEQKKEAGNAAIAATLQNLLSASMVNKNNKQAEDAAKQLMTVAEKQGGAIGALNKRMAQGMLGSIYLQSGRTNEGMAIMKSVASSMTAVNPTETGKAFTDEYADIDKVTDEAEIKEFS